MQGSVSLTLMLFKGQLFSSEISFYVLRIASDLPDYEWGLLLCITDSVES